MKTCVQRRILQIQMKEEIIRNRRRRNNGILHAPTETQLQHRLRIGRIRHEDAGRVYHIHTPGLPLRPLISILRLNNFHRTLNPPRNPRLPPRPTRLAPIQPNLPQ